MIENDPRIDPNLAVDLGDEHDKRRRADAEQAVKDRESELASAKAWYKAMRRMTGQRDRFDVFLKAEARRKAREQSA
jgi:hypothetical protein